MSDLRATRRIWLADYFFDTFFFVQKVRIGRSESERRTLLTIEHVICLERRRVCVDCPV